MQITRLVRGLALASVVLAIAATSFAGVIVSVNIAPPVLPVYTQPACPGDGYIWTPGYWAYAPAGYYWVPGTWVVAPQPGLLWTPGYWGFSSGAYLWHAGYWGPHVGFYGGVNYGFGYVGVGYAGGYWHGRTFFYNRSVNNIRVTNVHIYNRTVIEHGGRVAFNGGPGGIMVRPSHDQERFMHERHFEATRMQVDHEHGARENREFLASVNHGRPAIAATARPGEFRGRDVVAAHGGNDRHVDNRATNRNVPRPQNQGRSADRPMPRENAYNNRGGQPHNNVRPSNPAPQNRGAAATHPTAFHPDNNRSHESAPRPQKEGRGPKNR
ncbi:MAG TPA: YXWGXW repeat-containing protein [Terriglobales bacterium]|jgi:hypothetical protein|nr:YXWGXW repeat-containing protein [Terriglobales bacterium]